MTDSEENGSGNMDTELKQSETNDAEEIESKKSKLPRAGTMDVTALEGISILHREGISIDSTVDHLRSGGTFKSPASVEPDSTQTHQESSDAAKEATSAKIDAADVHNDNADGDEEKEGREEQPSELVTSSLEEKEEVSSKRERLQRTLTMAATMEEAKEILKDEELGKTRSKDMNAPSEAGKLEELAVEKKRGSLERTLTMAATLEESKEILQDEELGKTRSRDPAPDSTNDEITSPIRRTLTMMATIEEGQNVLGREQLGKTRSQDRKRRSLSRKSTDGQTPVKRKRR